MALESTLHVTEMSTRNLPGDKERPVHKADNLTAICEPIGYKMWKPRRLKTLLASTVYYSHTFMLFLLYFLLIKIQFFNMRNLTCKPYFIILFMVEFLYEKPSYISRISQW
jgi:hypothetical protein